MDNTIVPLRATLSQTGYENEALSLLVCTFIKGTSSMIPSGTETKALTLIQKLTEVVVSLIQIENSKSKKISIDEYLSILLNILFVSVSSFPILKKSEKQEYSIRSIKSQRQAKLP